MSDTVNIKTKIINSKHIKGKYSVPNANCILSYNNKKIKINKDSSKLYRTKDNSKSNNHLNKYIKPMNRSFIVKPKHKKGVSEVNFKTLLHKSNSKIKKTNINKINNIFKLENKIQCHARIKSLQINYKDKNNLYKLNKIEKNKESNSINNSKKKYKINNSIKKFEDDSKKNIISNKTNSLFEENEDNSTINTKILEQQKFVNIENNNHSNKFLILGEKNKKHIPNTEMNKKKEIHNNILKNSNMKNISDKNNNRVIIKYKMDNLKKNILINKSNEKRDSSNIIRTELNNSKKEIKNKKLIENIVQKIKEKINLIQTAKKNNNFNNAVNDYSIDVSLKRDKKNESSISHSLKLKKINIIKKSEINLKSSKKKFKSPINIRQNNNILNETNKNDNSPNVSIKDKKKCFKNKIKIFKRNRIKLNKEKDTFYNRTNILSNSNNTFFEDNKRRCKSNQSQKDLYSDFVEKTLNKEESTIKLREKSPKELAEKTIEKMDSISQKGYTGEDVEKINQDNFFIYKNFMNNPNYIFMGVCDGHGIYGHEVSSYLVYNIPLSINEILIKKKYKKITEKNKSNIISILKNYFLKIDKNISKETDIDVTFSGSTCVSAIFTKSKIICANVGDSRCILGKYNGKKWFSQNLSYDHKPDSIFESERIIKNGGKIEPYVDENGEYYGPKRVWVKYKKVPGLAMSRSFGDTMAHSVGVISEPEIFEYSILEEDKFIILASDGIWEFISSEECVNFVKDYYIKKDINGAINFLYKEASERWISTEEVIDDITLIIAFLK